VYFKSRAIYVYFYWRDRKFGKEKRGKNLLSGRALHLNKSKFSKRQKSKYYSKNLFMYFISSFQILKVKV